MTIKIKRFLQFSEVAEIEVYVFQIFTVPLLSDVLGKKGM